MLINWGTYVTTPEITNESAKVSIQVKVRNATDKDQNVKVRTIVLNKNGDRVAEVETPASVIKDSVTEVSQELKVKNPELWSIENPNLYKAVTTIDNGSRTTDDYATTFGIRTIKFDLKQRIFLKRQACKNLGSVRSS